MFVTSDIYDMPAMARWARKDWREWLVAGIGFAGPHWAGFHLGCRFLTEAAALTGLTDNMIYAGYNVPNEWRTKPLSPSTIFKAARDSNNRYQQKASSALFQGKLMAPFGKSYAFVGGSISSFGDLGQLSGSFIYNLNKDTRIDLAKGLLKLASNLIMAEYGYFYIRDCWLMPETYSAGMNASIVGNYTVDRKPLPRDQNEISAWPRRLRGGYWNEPNPRMRDVYEVNLISERHLGRQFGTSTLGEWMRSSAAHGELEDIGNGRHIWSLNTRQMQHVRPQLILADAIYARHERVYRPD